MQVRAVSDGTRVTGEFLPVRDSRALDARTRKMLRRLTKDDSSPEVPSTATAWHDHPAIG